MNMLRPITLVPTLMLALLSLTIPIPHRVKAIDSNNYETTVTPDTSWLLSNNQIDVSKVHIENVIGLSAIAADTIPSEVGKPTTLLLADEIVFGSQNYSSSNGTCPRNVVIAANTIRLDGWVKFNLSRDRGDTVEQRSGGSLILIAHTLYFGDQGFLSFNGSAGYRWEGAAPLWVKAGQDGGNGGGLDIIVDQVKLSPVKTEGLVTFIADPINSLLIDFKDKPFPEDQKQYWYQSADTVFRDPTQAEAYKTIIESKPTYDNEVLRILAHIQKERIRVTIETGTKEQYLENLFTFNTSGGYPGVNGHSGQAGVRRSVIGVGADSKDAVTTRVLAARWVVEFLRTLIAQTLTKSANSAVDRRELIRLFRAFDALPAYPVANTPYADDYLKLIDKFSELRREKVLPVWFKTALVEQTGSAPIPVSVFFEEAQTDGYAAPTDALLTPIEVDGKERLGVLSYDPNDPNVIRITFSSQLVLGRPVASKLPSMLQKSGEKLAGVFTKWRLEAVGDVPGLRSCDLRVNGTRMDCTLEIENSDVGYFALLQLAGPYGLPLKIKWTSTKDPQVSDLLTELRLSIARRVNPALVVSNGAVTNRAHVPVTLDWLEVGDDFVPVRRKFDPYQSIQVSSLIPGSPGLTSVTIAPEALSYDMSASSGIAEDFQIAQQLVERFLLLSLIPDSDPTLGTLKCLEITLTRVSGEGTVAKAQSYGPYCLKAAQTSGDSVTVPVLKFPGQQRRVFIEGVAKYSGGVKSIPQQEVSGSSVFIKPEMLR